MNRRAFVTGLGAVLAAPLAAAAQPSRSVVVGFVSSGSRSIAKDFVTAFDNGLSETGYIHGKNVEIEYRWADGHYDRLPALVTELINRDAAVIVAGGPPAALAAKSVTSALPIVFIASDAVPLGLVASLNRPGGNVTGVSILGTSLWPKRLELMSELVPKSLSMSMLVNPRSKEEPTANEVQETARKFGRQLSIVTATTESEIDSAFSVVVQQHVGALLVSPDPLFTSRSDQIVRLAAHYSLPAIYGWRQHVTAGGLISYGASLTDAWYRAGAYTGRIPKGAKPADLPVEQPTKFELVINLKTAKALGLTLAAKHRLPSMYGVLDDAAVGGLMAYAADDRDNWRRAAMYVAKILKGAKPADLPVEQPTKFELVINLKTAKALGLTIPPSLLLRAHQIIE